MMGFDLLVPKRNKQKMCQVDRRWFFWCVINAFKRQKSTALFFWHEPDINYLHMSFSMFNYFDSNMEAKTINLPKIS